MFNTVLAVAIMTFWAAIFPRNVVASIYVDQEMTSAYGVTVTPTQFQFYALESRRSFRRRSRGTVAKFMSADFITTWRPADADLPREKIGECVTLHVWRNVNGAVLVEGLETINPRSFHRCVY